MIKSLTNQHDFMSVLKVDQGDVLLYWYKK